MPQRTAAAGVPYLVGQTTVVKGPFSPLLIRYIAKPIS